MGAYERGDGQCPPVDPPSSNIQLELALSSGSQTNELHGRLELRWRKGAEQPQCCTQDDLIPVLGVLQTIHHQSGVPVHFAADVPEPIKNIVLGRSDIDLAELRTSETIESELHHAQFKIAAVLGVDAIVALCLFVFLLADQLHRSGNITPLGLVLGLALVLSPAMLAAHVAMGRTRIRVGPNQLKIISRNGLLGNRRWEVSTAEVQGMWLVDYGEGSPHELVIKSQDSFRSIPLWGSAQPRTRSLIHLLGLQATDPSVHDTACPARTD